MKKITMILMALVLMSGCGGFIGNQTGRQIIADQDIIDMGEVAIDDLVRHIKKNHPEDIPDYIEHSETMLKATDDIQFETLLKVAIDTVINAQISDPLVATPVKMLSRMLMSNIDIDTEALNLDNGQVKVARAMVERFKKGLEE
jgi:hypothetical protein